MRCLGFISVMVCLAVSGFFIAIDARAQDAPPAADTPPTDVAAELAPEVAADTSPDTSPSPAIPPNTPTDNATPDATASTAAPNVQAPDDPMARFRKDAALAYEELVGAYLNSDWDALTEQLKTIRRHRRFFNRQQRSDVAYIQKSAKDFRPKWWTQCSSSSNISFQAELWNRPLMANYMPTRMLGAQSVQAEGEYRRNRRGEYEPVVTKLNVIVTWKPSLVDSDTPGTGKLAEVHGMKLGDLGEVIVWHELGHCYITNYLPMQHVIELYNQHAMLFGHLQEFYADLTALYHASPRARRVTLMLRLESLDRYDESEEHTRASLAVGALVLHEVLANPDDWPSFHLPPAVPRQQVELNTIIYLYEHMDPGWSLKEARALRELAKDFISKSGEKTLRARGVFPLPNKLKFSLMAGQDHKLQAKRDEYVAKRLEALIESGRADTLDEDETYDPPLRRPLRDGEKVYRDPEALRIDIPM
jgi:hypothetical protein